MGDAGAPVVRGIRLLSPRTLPDRVRFVFPFPFFNAVQSKCLPQVFHSDDNFVLSSPTGSGKTVIFELAICRLLLTSSSLNFKAVYMAPLKALCSERARDWQIKFRATGLTVGELTGDSDNSAVSLKVVRESNLIVTTPEKWDSMTRKRKDHEKLAQMIRLLLIDEVHILDKDRGATLEAVVSRMKSIGTEMRFIALSATIPNANDIAAWLGRSPQDPRSAANLEEFGDDFRPVRLTRHILGYDTGGNDFQLDALLSKMLPDVIKTYTHGKPILIFCFTRASCVKTAELLAKWMSGQQRPLWATPGRDMRAVDATLTRLMRAGVAFHHGGVAQDDRRMIEAAFLDGHIGVICCTSTLAIGINLPCHTVIIKGTMSSGNGFPSELSDMEILQMLGRAGRPQFGDQDAVAVVMTRRSREAALHNLMDGSKMVESRLHLNLLEHLNAEIGLGFIRSLTSAVDWLSGTFLYVRLQANPAHYRNEDDPIGYSPDESVQSICSKALDLLVTHDLVADAPALQQTAYGAAMSRYYVSFQTMNGLLGLGPAPKISEILSAICTAHEFKDIRLRQNERTLFKDINSSPAIMFPFKVNLALGAQKVSLMLQAILGGIESTLEGRDRFQFSVEQTSVLQQARRLIRCVVDCQVSLSDARGIKNALMLVRSLGAKVWDNSPLCLQQLQGIGPVAARKLIAAGFMNVDDVLAAEATRLEMVLGKNSPFGAKLQKIAAEFPSLRVGVATIGRPILKHGKPPVVNLKVEIGFLNETPPTRFNGMEIFICLLVERSDGRKVDFARLSAAKVTPGFVKSVEAELTTHGQMITCHVSCEEIAGTLQTASIVPDVPASAFKGLVVERPVIAASKPPAIAAARDGSGRHGQLTAQDDTSEFGNGSISDTDLAAAEQVTRIQRGDIKSTGKHAVKAKAVKQSTATPSDEVPERLPNGNWKCRHHCKDKTKCVHVCCKEGTESKPKPRSQKKTQQNKNIAEVFAKQKSQEAGTVAPKSIKRPLEEIDLTNAENIPPGIVSLQTPRPKVHERPAKTARSNEDASEFDDEFDGFEDIDFDLPTLQPPSAPKPALKPQKPVLKEPKRVDPSGAQSRIEISSASSSQEMEEELLDAALVGAEDSYILRSSAVHSMAEQPQLAAADLLSTVNDMASGERGGDILPGNQGQRPAESQEEAELRSLRDFMHAHFGDLVEIV